MKESHRMDANLTFPSSADDFADTYENIQKFQLRTEPSGTSRPPTASRRSKVTAERAALLVLSALLTAAVVALGVIVSNMQTLEGLKVKCENENKNLTERLQMKQNSTGTPVCPRPTQWPQTQTCKKCEENWKENQGKCYKFSTNKLSWQQSRQNCLNQRGDLVTIHSEDEQRFLTEEVNKLMKDSEDMFWIGLTDLKVEGRWVWTDGSSLDQSLTYWGPEQPDNSRGTNNEYPEGQDCVRMGGQKSPDGLRPWFDRQCDDPQRFICEKAATDGHKVC